MTSEQSVRGQFGIGEVLAQLRPEFPDISTSKIRFLEAEGLIEPARSRSGYRRFSAADIERLRYILTMQRDSYLPLRVIRERLADGGGGAGAADGHAAGRAPADMTRRQLLEAAEISEAELTELEDYGLIRRVGRQYAGDALAVARALAALRQYGVQPRHLRAVKTSADREANLVEQAVAPQLRQRGAGARDAAARTAWQIADLTLRLHATLMESALAEAGLASAPLHARVLELEAASGPVPDASRHATVPANGSAAGGLRSASGRLRVYLGKGSGGQQRFPQAREDGAVVRQMEVIGVRVEMPSNSPIVLLKEAQGDRYLPIWIGAVEATAIAFAQQGMVSLRPLTHDLFKDVLEVLNVQLRTVNITALRDGIFYADLVFSNGAEVSARPSDSIALALRTGAQIFASDEILDEAGVAIPEEPEDNETEVEKFREFLDTISPEDFGRAT